MSLDNAIPLRDLNATFVGKFEMIDGQSYYTRQPFIEGAQGVLFQCPKCAFGKLVEEEVIDGQLERFVRGAHYVLCWFTNPRNAQRVPDEMVPGPGRWAIAGSSLDDLTFVGPAAASVLLTAGCNWHGFVKNGHATL